MHAIFSYQHYQALATTLDNITPLSFSLNKKLNSQHKQMAACAFQQ
jgi:hypothetical protein